jgi:hypothetical protein
MKQAPVSVSVAETVPLQKTLFAQLLPLADAHRPLRRVGCAATKVNGTGV